VEERCGLEAPALSQYRLPDPRVIGPLPASSRNDNFLVEDAAGGRYVLRRNRRNPHRERVEFQLRLQRHLLRHGVPTARVIETRDGAPLLALAHDLWSLFTFVEGTEYDYRSQRQVGEAARWLARFHRACEGFRAREVRTDTIPDVRRWWLDGAGELRRLDGLFAGRGVDAELGFLRRWRSRLLGVWPLATLDDLPAAWVHGDYHGRNMVFAGDELAGLFDFDVAHRGFRIEDVALALFTFGREHHGSNRIRSATARVFLDEYEQVARLTELERRALPTMVVLVHARTAARYALRQRGGDDAVGALRSHVRRMRALSAQVTSSVLFEGG
jgi:homoserine kinase type II